MTPEECWQIYAGGVSPGEFVRRFDTRDPGALAAQFVEAQGVVFGKVRRRLWRDTFAAEEQHTRETVENLIAARLEETREAWEAVPISAPSARPAPELLPPPPEEEASADADDGVEAGYPDDVEMARGEEE